MTVYQSRYYFFILEGNVYISLRGIFHTADLNDAAIFY